MYELGPAQLERSPVYGRLASFIDLPSHICSFRIQQVIQKMAGARWSFSLLARRGAEMIRRPSRAPVERHTDNYVFFIRLRFRFPSSNIMMLLSPNPLYDSFSDLMPENISRSILVAASHNRDSRIPTIF